MKIAVCGLVSNSTRLFLGLSDYLESRGHGVYFVEPAYSGAVCLLSEQRTYFSIKSPKASLESKIDYHRALWYEDALLELEMKGENWKKRRRNTLYQEAVQLANSLEMFITRNHIDLVLTWGGFQLHSAIASHVASSLSVPCMHFEKGMFPRTLQCDTIGVNAANSAKSLLSWWDSNEGGTELEEYHRMISEKWFFSQPLDSIPFRIKARYFTNSKEYLGLLRKVFDSARDRLIPRFKSNRRWNLNDPFTNGQNALRVEPGYVFVPLQVADDSQLLCYGKWIRSNEKLIEVVAAAAALVDQTLRVVVKPHPGEYRKVDYRNVVSGYGNVHMTNWGTLDLIKHAGVVVTINSTVGFEAILHRKAVIVLGDALYDQHGFVDKAESLEDVTDLIRTRRGALLQRKPVEKFAGTAYALFVACDFTNPSLQDIARLWSFIVIHLKKKEAVVDID